MNYLSLQKEFVRIDQVAFGEKSYVDGHTMYLNRDELAEMAMCEYFTRVNIDMVVPGESARINNCSDIIQPTLRLEDEESTFPGALGALRRVGSGRTLALLGVAVAEACEVRTQLSCNLDMSGEIAQFSPYTQMIQVVVNPKKDDGATDSQYMDGLKTAALTIAVFLAKLARDCERESTETYTMERDPEKLKGLPREAYLYGVFSHAPHTDFLFYGDNGNTMLPTIIQPTEILDGAMVDREYYQMTNGEPTYTNQNHPVLLELMKRHGVDLNFVGVVMSNAPHKVVDKERNTMMAATLAKYTLDAECILITKQGGGHPQLDMAMAAETCQALDIKAVLLLFENLTPGDGTDRADEAVLFSSPAADAMVSIGIRTLCTCPPVKHSVGEYYIEDASALQKCMPDQTCICKHRNTRGSCSQYGLGDWTSVKY